MLLPMLPQPTKLAQKMSNAKRMPIKGKVKEAVMVEGWPI
jgi:hypothetical protein